MNLILLFLSAFGAATLLPLQSEAVLLGSFALKQFSPWMLIFVASVANVMGSCVNWWLGLKIEQFKTKKWFPFKSDQMIRAQRAYQQYGTWSLLLSWVPIIGDPITLIAGILKEKFWKFIFVVGIAKTGRYLFIYWVYLGLF